MSKSGIYLKPVIQSNQIVSIEVQNVTLPLREPVPVAKLAELVDAIERFVKYVDVERMGEKLPKESLKPWSAHDLREFVLTELRDDQALALKVLTESAEISRKDFVQKMAKLLGKTEFRGWNLGGMLAGITMKAKSWGYESPYKSEYRPVGREWECFYYLTREEYKDIIASALKERK